MRNACACGKLDVGLPEGPPFFRFNDWHECERVLLDYDYNAPADVVVWHSGHFQLRWDAMDHAPDECLIESEFFSIGELAPAQDH